MITEEIKRIIPIDNDTFTICSNEYLVQILNCLKLAVPHFQSACHSSEDRKLFNEDDLTQVFYSQVQCIIRQQNYLFNIGNQERDLTKQSKGIADLYFYINRLNKPPISIFSIECKRLPAPSKKREKEYVIGNNNGGIERFKTGKHAKSLNKCGMIGFVEKETFQHWQTTINLWIEDLIEMNDFWKNDEKLSESENRPDYSVLTSTAHRTSSKDVFLYHLWINIQ